MGKLIYTHGVMSSGKSALLCQKNYQFSEAGYNVLVLKPSLDTRDGKVTSRIGLSVECLIIEEGQLPSDVVTDFIDHEDKYPDIILVDEAQFLNGEQVEDLARIAHNADIMVMAFGLKCDFEGKLFEGTQHLFALANRSDELAAMCDCGRKATMHIRLTNQTEQVVCGDMDIYKSVCTKCFLEHKDGE